MSGRSHEEQYFPAGIPLSEESITKTFKIEEVSWRGTGDKMILIDTPGLADPEGSAADREAFRDVIWLLKNEVDKINLIIHVVKKSDTRKLPHLQSNLKILKFMFGDALKTNFVNEVSFWAHYDTSKEDRANFTARRNKKHQDLFDDDALTVETVFIDPIEALPRKIRETKMGLYNQNNEALVTQSQEVEKLRKIIWNDTPFSCKETCNFAEGWSTTKKIEDKSF